MMAAPTAGLAADGGPRLCRKRLWHRRRLGTGTGKRLWEKSLGVPIRTSPTSANERVYVTSIEGRLYCLSGIDGTELWSVRGLPQQASLGLNSSPAVEGDIVVVPYASGDLVGLKVSDGTAVWSESLSRTRTTSQLASMSDAARPAIDGGVVFADRPRRPHGRNQDQLRRASLVTQRTRHADAMGGG